MCSRTTKGEYVAGGRTVTKGKDKDGGSNVIKAKIQAECREGMRGGTTKAEYVGQRSTVTRAKVEAKSRKEKGIRRGLTK